MRCIVCVPNAVGHVAKAIIAGRQLGRSEPPAVAHRLHYRKSFDPAVKFADNADALGLRPIESELHATINRDGCHGTASLSSNSPAEAGHKIRLFLAPAATARRTNGCGEVSARR